MKKLVLTAAFAVPFIFNAQLMSEDFESYSDGDTLSVVGVANGWGEWNGGTGTPESCTVSSMYATSGANSGKSMEPNDGLWSWPDISSGSVNVSMKLYVPVGGAGGYIGLGDSEMSDQPHSINLLGDTLVIVLDWAAQALVGQATVTPGTWFTCDLLIDMDNGTSEFFVDGVSVGTGGTGFGAANVGFGGMDWWGTSYDPFTGNQAPGEYYFDDLLITDPNAGLEEGTSMSLSIAPNPSNGKFAINFNDYAFDNASMTITNMMGAVVYSEQLSSVSNSTQNFDLDLNSGVYLVKVADDLNEFTTRVVIK